MTFADSLNLLFECTLYSKGSLGKKRAYNIKSSALVLHQ